MINWSSYFPAGNEEEYLLLALRSGWVSGGAYVSNLESSLDEIFSGSRSFAVSNGTVALQLALQVMGPSGDDEVIVPAFAFQAAGNVALQLGVNPVFCDVDGHSWNQSIETIEQVVTERTVGIVVVHNYGMAAPIEEICEWAKHKGIWVIEDCAEAWFSKYREKYLGQYGDIATFSMHATKTIACGEGGVVLVNRDYLLNRTKLYRSHGLERREKHYYHLEPGNNYRLSNLLCALALAQIEQREEILRKQDYHYQLYKRLLSEHWAVQFQSAVEYSKNEVWATAIKIDFEELDISRDELIELLLERNIEVRPGFYPAATLPYHSHRSFVHTIVSEDISKHIIVLPTNGSVTDEKVNTVCRELLDLIAQNSKFRTLKFIPITNTPESLDILSSFLDNLKVGSKNFRYFQSRSLQVIEKHEVTLLLKHESNIVAYGHLEEEGDELWLGIAVSDGHIGLGWGLTMMRQLEKEAIDRGLRVISLRVDIDNYAAQRLYLKMGYSVNVEKSNQASYLMEKHMPTKNV